MNPASETIKGIGDLKSLGTRETKRRIQNTEHRSFGIAA